MRHWIKAFRLRTLPLALASIGMGAFLAAASGSFRADIFALCVLTTIFLQILSNLANDYGDSIHGADGENRLGPTRAVQSGVISRRAMLKAIVLLVVLSLGSGIGLIYLAFGWSMKVVALFLALGVLAIIAAITYTAGNRPYGYTGFGDLSVLLFFGFVAVMGSAYLYEQQFNGYYALPAVSTGLFSVAVLNVNNIRDLESDRKAGKFSIPVRIGRERAVRYHWWLLALGFGAALLYISLHFRSPFQLLVLLAVPLLLKNARAVKIHREAASLDPFLKQMALSTLFFVILFGLGQLLD